MKKQYLYAMISMVMVAIAGSCFTACSSNDDDEQSSSGRNILVGSWYNSWSNDSRSGSDTYTFYSDGTGTFRWEATDYDPYDYNSISNSFRYEIVEYDNYLKTGTFIIRYAGSSDYRLITFRINGNQLTIDGQTYTKR